MRYPIGASRRRWGSGRRRSGRPPVESTRQTNNAWINGSFYLFAFVTVLGVIRVAFGELGAAWLPLTGVLALLLILVIGAMQLKNDEKFVDDQSFLKLMLAVLSKIPGIGSLMPQREQ